MIPHVPWHEEHYGWQWVAVLCVLLAITTFALMHAYRGTLRLAPPRLDELAGGADWFLMIRLPEAPAERAEAAAFKARFASWLDALREQRFQPMLLSTALWRLDRGLPLPKRTVILLFDPGFRRTYDTLAPVLEQRRWPAVWLTDRQALRRGDRRYVSRHVIRSMNKSLLWDVAWYRANDATFSVEFTGRQRWYLGHRRWAFGAEAGTAALNQGGGHPYLKRFHAQPDWTAQQLVDRLLAETPVTGPSYLTMREIPPRRWGVALDMDASPASQPFTPPQGAGFTLQAPLDRRTTAIVWPSTLACYDLQLELQIPQWFGQVWIALRADSSRRDNVRVGFLEEQIVVEQDAQGVRKRLAAVAWFAPRDQPLQATLMLRNRELHVALNHVEVLTVDSLQEPEVKQGMIELAVYDKVRGAAELQSAQLLITPLAAAP